VNDLLTPDDVEDRVCRTLAARAEQMAPGDGAGWDLGGPVVVPTDVPGGDVGFGPSRSRGRRELRAAAAALILVIGGAAAIAIKRGDDRGRVASQDPVTTGASTTAATTAPGDAARPLSDVAYPIGEYEGEGYRIHALFEDGATANLVPPTPAWQRVRVGDHEGYHAALPNSAMSELWVVFDDGVVVLRGRSLPRERLIAAGATVTRDPDTGRYTMPAPPGWTTLWTTPPDVDSPVPESDVVGRFVSTADPAGKNFTVFWYPGWDETNVAEGAELVQVGDGEGYIGTIAPEASDLSPLWITYRDGVVEPASGRHVPRRVDRGWSGVRGVSTPPACHCPSVRH
jgi:hypothetical protein